jgi:hypothetical protein
MHREAIKKLQEIVAVQKRHKCDANKIIIKETDKNATLNHVVIEGVSGDVIAIELDRIGLGDKTFNDGYKAQKSCDAVIFCEYEGEAYILILDVKSSYPSDEKYIAQLVGGDCFADYLVSVLELFENIKSNWIRRYFIFHGSAEKRTTLPNYDGSLPKNTKADKADLIYIENAGTINLRKLLHKPPL